MLDRPAGDDLHECRFPIWDQSLEPRDFRRHRAARCRHRLLPQRRLRAARARKRRPRHRASLCPHDDPAPLALLADGGGDRALARQRPLLPAEPDRRRSQESRGAHLGGFAHCHRSAGRFHRRRHCRIPVGLDLHRRAVDDRRSARAAGRRGDHHHSPAFSSSLRLSMP